MNHKMKSNRDSISFFFAASSIYIAIGFATPLPQQELPNELKSLFGNGPSATSFEYTYPFELKPVSARVTFSNRSDPANSFKNQVEVVWKADSPVDGIHYVDQFISTVFQPTAVTRHNAKTDTMYVAGWFAATGEVVVERWRFKTKAYPIKATAFPAPKVIRTELFRCGSLQPLSSMVRNPNANELWMLEWELDSPKKLLSLDLDNGSPACSSFLTMYDGGNPADVAAYPLMDSLRQIYAGTHPTAGWIVYFEQRPAWTPLNKYSTPYQMLVGFDGDTDGILNSLSPMTYTALYTSFPFSEWLHAEG